MHLSNNPDFYAGLDVFNPEPPDLDDEIFKYKNLVMTPHSAAYTEERLKKCHYFVVKILITFSTTILIKIY